jgi:pimeloyl-ACP methyl ester carboxylesterase
VTDGFIAVDGLRLHYQRWGAPDASPNVVLVHGLGSTSHIWDLVAPQLAERFAVVALDQRGHGESDQPDTGYDFRTIVADLAGFFDALDVRGPALAVGHSWGASVVLHFGVTHPDRTAGVVLLDGGTSSPGERWDWDQTLARLTPPDIDGRTWDSLRQRMTSSNGLYNDPRVAAISRSLFRFDADGRLYRRLTIPNHLRILRSLWEQRPAELLPQLECPLLVLPARQASDAPEMAANKAVNVQRTLDLQPRARVRWFEDTIHDVPLQRPDELGAELLAFAEEVLAVSPTTP